MGFQRPAGSSGGALCCRRARSGPEGSAPPSHAARAFSSASRSAGRSCSSSETAGPVAWNASSETSLGPRRSVSITSAGTGPLVSTWTARRRALGKAGDQGGGTAANPVGGCNRGCNRRVAYLPRIPDSSARAEIRSRTGLRPGDFKSFLRSELRDNSGGYATETARVTRPG